MTVIEGELRALVGVRAFAAASVVAWHALPIFMLMFGDVGTREHGFGLAVLAVDFFFMLSGFILTEKYLTLLSRPSWSTARDFYTLGWLASGRCTRRWSSHSPRPASWRCAVSVSR